MTSTHSPSFFKLANDRRKKYRHALREPGYRDAKSSPEYLGRRFSSARRKILVSNERRIVDAQIGIINVIGEGAAI